MCTYCPCLLSPSPAVFQHHLAHDLHCFFIHAGDRRYIALAPVRKLIKVSAARPFHRLPGVGFEAVHQYAYWNRDISLLRRKIPVKFQHIIFIKAFKDRVYEKTSLYPVQRSFIQRQCHEGIETAPISGGYAKLRSAPEADPRIIVRIAEYNYGPVPQFSCLLKRMHHKCPANTPVLEFRKYTESPKREHHVCFSWRLVDPGLCVYNMPNDPAVR